ncbi:MAG: hypothetical protein ACKOW9_01675 [Candidatus Paceibacterota bacterium]
MFTVHRSESNPILSPQKKNPWESKATFNGCPIKISKNETAIVYRAMSEPDIYKNPNLAMSIIGIAYSKNGEEYGNTRPFITPSEDFDKYGCEDPRVTKIDDVYYIFYTALGGFPFGPENIKTAVALSYDMKTIFAKYLVTPFNSKAMALFPERINGKLGAFITIDTDQRPSNIGYITFDKPEQIWSHKRWQKWYSNKEKNIINLKRKSDEHVELGAPPILTQNGWLIIYSHIQHYDTNNVIFGIEAVLMDTKDPKKLIAQTKGPFIVPEWYYEKIGQIPNIVFPSGALVKKDVLEIYYGGADNFCLKATLSLNGLINAIIKGEEIERCEKNPILSPRDGFTWEQEGVLNPAAIEIDGTIHLIYRAVANGNKSTFGYANTKDGHTILERSDEPIYKPREDFESHGCEDPRLIRDKNTIYMMYTGYNGQTPRIVVSHIDVKDFKNKKWEKWSKPYAITPETLPDKDAAFIPEKFKKGYLVLHRAGNGICGDYFPSLDFEKDQITKCIDIANVRHGMWDNTKIGLATPLIKTKYGWIMIYHGISENKSYRVGAMLLDPKDPSIVLSRTALPFFEPKETYECNGVVSNVVFPCGLIERNDYAYIYYGAADKYVGMAKISIKKLLELLKISK